MIELDGGDGAPAPVGGEANGIDPVHDRAQAQLASARAQIVGLLEDLPHGCVITDCGGRIREANEAAAAMLGVEAKVLRRAKLLIAFVARSDTRAFRETLRTLGRRADRGPLVVRARVRMRRRGGPVFVTEIAGRAMLGNRGEVVGLRWILQPEPAPTQ